MTNRSGPTSSLPPFNVEKIFAILIRVVVWMVFFGILYVLKSFFLLIFLTFVFAYIQANAVERLRSLLPQRTVRVVVVALLILSILVGIGSFLIPQVKEEGYNFIEKLPSYLSATDSELLRIRQKYPVLGQLIPGIEPIPGHGEQEFTKSPTGVLLHNLMSFGNGESGNFGHTIDAARNLGAYLASIGSSFFLSLLFSFLIVLDLPSLTKSANSLRKTKIGFIYEEVAPSIANFSRVMGRALEAQMFIAFLNTFLTAIGLLILGLGSKITFLSLIVFSCSFIPVAGVIMSSVPICLLALQGGGLVMAIFAVLLIILIHMIETYILNPRIYGHHLRMNPVVVLIILTVGGKMFHVWGLILGVPICTYIFGHAIQYRASEGAEHS